MMALHRVVYHRLELGMMAGHIRSLLDHNVDRWLAENCQGRYYHNPAWTREKFIEFEDGRDAMWFALRYGQ